MNRNRWKTTMAALAVAGVALSSATAMADDRPEVVVAVNSLARTLEPAERDGNVDVRIVYSMYDTLIRWDFLNPMPNGDTRLVPGLATAWKRIDPRTLELTLRKGVKFHNGDEMTADDVVFTFSPERLWGKDSALAYGRPYFGHLEKVEKIDAYTVRFTTAEPDLILEKRLSTYASFVVNARQWLGIKARVEKENAGKPTDQQKDWKQTALKEIRWNPVGTGPYKFKSWRKDGFIELEAFDDYFMGKPTAKKVTFRVVPEVAARIAGLVSGEFNIAVDIPPDQIDVLKRYDDIELKPVVLDNVHLIVFNTTHPVLKDKRVRQALSLAIDRQLLVKTLWTGMTTIPNGHQLPEFGELYNKDRSGYVYDPEKAEALLKEAGYKGEAIDYRMIPNYYLNGMEAAQIVQEMWKKVGFNVELKMAENFDRVRTPDVGVYAWSNTFRLPDPIGSLLVNWGARSAVQRKTKYWTPPEEFNNLESIVETGTEMAARAKAFQRMLDIFEDEMPMTILYSPLEVYAVNKKVQWKPYEQYFMDFRPYNLTFK
ncbi:ABC transporter substrate-binding protein [Shumkonia mesophila]|uniref:ABC transporter substrate-binding protein n=1 Tax=Shumkonia mesophila TaxID=2838854 RepID=UPI002934A917|nr:ABC transporter substrate-binding protein [Shumkonia mesophila]